MGDDVIKRFLHCPQASVRQDLAKIRHFGKVLKAFGRFFEGLLSIWKIYEPILEISYASWQIFIPINIPMSNKYSSHLVTLVPI